MGGHPESECAFLAQRRDGFHIAIQECLERLALPHRRVGLRQFGQALEGKEKLHRHRLFAPQRAVIVEGRDAVFRRRKIAAAILGHAIDEIDDHPLGGAIVPGRQYGRHQATLPGVGLCSRERHMLRLIAMGMSCAIVIRRGFLHCKRTPNSCGATSDAAPHQPE
nr:hypothetical protein [Mesorhizobium sp.]